MLYACTLGGATVEDVSLMAGLAHNAFKVPLNGERTPTEHVKVKASGGIRTGETAIAMLEAGADRLGTSASVAVLKEAAAILEARHKK
jgi:deoxyribose-phosphate aldolase